MALNPPAGPEFPPPPRKIIDMEERVDGSFVPPGTPEIPEIRQAAEAAEDFIALKSTIYDKCDALDVELADKGFDTYRDLDGPIGIRMDTCVRELDAIVDYFNSARDAFDDVKAKVYTESLTRLREVHARWQEIAAIVRELLIQSLPESVDSDADGSEELGELTKENKDKWLEARHKELAYFMRYETILPRGVDLATLSPQLFGELQAKRSTFEDLLRNIPYLFADSGIPATLVKSRAQTIVELKRTLSGIVHQFEQLIATSPVMTGRPKEESPKAAAAKKDPFAESPHPWLQKEAREVYDTEKGFEALKQAHPDLEQSSQSECDEVTRIVAQSKILIDQTALTANSDINQPLLAAYKSNLEKNRRRLSELMLVLGQKVVAIPLDLTPEQKATEKNRQEFEEARNARHETRMRFKAAEAAFAVERDKQAKIQAAKGEFKNYFGVEAEKTPEYQRAEKAYLEAGLARRDAYYKEMEIATKLETSAPPGPGKKVSDRYRENKIDRVMLGTIAYRRVEGELKAREEAIRAERSNTNFGKGLLLYDKVKASIAGSAPVQMVGTALYGGEGERRTDGKMLLRGKLLVGGVGALAVAGGGVLGLGAAAGAWATSAGVLVAAKYGTKSVLNKLFVNGTKAELESNKATDAQTLRKGSLQALQKIANKRIATQLSLKRSERLVRDVTTGVGVGFGAGFGLMGGRTWAQGLFNDMSAVGNAQGATLPRGPGAGSLTIGPDVVVPERRVVLVGPDGAPYAVVEPTPPTQRVTLDGNRANPLPEAAAEVGPREFPSQTIDVTSAHSRRGLTGILDNAIRSGNPEIYDRLNAAQRDRLMSEVFRQVQSDPALMQRVGVRSGNVNLIIAGRDQINVHELLRLADERATAIRGAAPVVPPVAAAPVATPVPLGVRNFNLSPTPEMVSAAAATETAIERAGAEARGQEFYAPTPPQTGEILPPIDYHLDEERIGAAARAEAPVMLRETEGADTTIRIDGDLVIAGGGDDAEITFTDNTTPVGQTEVANVSDDAPFEGVFRLPENASLDNGAFREFVTQRFGGEEQFLKVRNAMADSINSPTQTFFGFLTGANDNTAERVFAGNTVTEFESTIRRPQLVESGVKIENFNRWKRELVALMGKLEVLGVAVDPEETTVEELLTLAAANDVNGEGLKLAA